MAATYDLLIKGGTVVLPGATLACDIAVRDGLIADLGDLNAAAAGEVVDATGLHVLPGVIDSQVHFREPGLEHKEDLATGTAAAALGGVTSIFEMPNTKPPTIDAAALNDKLARADGRAWTDYAFFVGAGADNVEQLPELERLPGVSGIKVFMGASTGSLLVDDAEVLEEIARRTNRRFSVHAEDEARLRDRLHLVKDGAPVEKHPEWRDVEAAVIATRQVCELCRKHGGRVQVLHISTADEMDVLAQYKDVATVEVTPQHLTLEAPECYRVHGTHVQMNPPIRDARHREGLWRGVQRRIVDVIGSDHAPHAADEKDKPYPSSPSGMPGVQTLLPLMLDHVNAGRLSLEHLVELTAAGPARAFGVMRKGRIAVGYDADLTLVDLKRSEEIRLDWLASRAGWSPFAGRTVTGWPVTTVLRGRAIARDGELVGAPQGRQVRFLETLRESRA
jgi:dihydroorotase